MATLNNQSNKSVSSKCDNSELKEILKKLSKSLKELSTNVALLEKYVLKNDTTNISDEENGFESAEESCVETKVIKSKKSLQRKSLENSSFSGQDTKETVPIDNSSVICRRTSCVKDIKRKFELKRQQHFENRSSESSDIQTSIEIYETVETNNKVQDLKKKFEIVDNSANSDLCETRVLKKVEKNEMQNWSNQYNEKIQKVLKYFKPQQ